MNALNRISTRVLLVDTNGEMANTPVILCKGNIPNNRTNFLVQLFSLWCCLYALQRRTSACISPSVTWYWHLGVLLQGMMVISFGADDGADLTWLLEVDFWVGWWEGSVGCANHRANLGRHLECDVVKILELSSANCLL